MSGCFGNLCGSDDSVNIPFQWSRDLEKHTKGEFSMCAVKANTAMEDCSKVDVGSNALFLGIFGGRGVQASNRLGYWFLYELLGRIHNNNNNMSYDILKETIFAVEEQFMSLVAAEYKGTPSIVCAGSSCLVGIFWSGVLYIANLGDSRAIVASEIGNTGILKIDQLTKDHNTGSELTRLEIRAKHPDDPDILRKVGEVGEKEWRIKGLIQVSRSIGDAYLKRKLVKIPEEHNDIPKVPEPFSRPLLSIEPDIYSSVIRDEKYLLFASHGFWKFMSNEEAILMIQKSARHGIARKLVKTAMEKAARAKNISYRDLLAITERKNYHDDITVIVVFFRQRNWRREIPNMSYKSFSNTNLHHSEFSLFTY